MQGRHPGPRWRHSAPHARMRERKPPSPGLGSAPWLTHIARTIIAAPTSSTAPPPRTLRRWDRPPQSGQPCLTRYAIRPQVALESFGADGPWQPCSAQSRQQLRPWVADPGEARPIRVPGTEPRHCMRSGKLVSESELSSRPRGVETSTRDPVTVPSQAESPGKTGSPSAWQALVTNTTFGAGMATRGGTREAVDFIDVGELRAAQIQTALGDAVVSTNSVPGSGDQMATSTGHVSTLIWSNGTRSCCVRSTTGLSDQRY